MDFFERSIINLRNQRKVFHSEDDLKLALALIIKEINPNFQIRLERPIDITMIDRNGIKTTVRAPIDIIVIDENGYSIPIELKYKTAKVDITDNGEEYSLTAHGATDIGRYGFRKDIYRVEQYLSSQHKCENGFVFILTNDALYFNNDSIKNVLCKNFSFHEGKVISKSDDSWHYNDSHKTKYTTLDENDNVWKHLHTKNNHWTCEKELFYKLDLLNDYTVNWLEFSEIGNVVFKYCLFRIDYPSLKTQKKYTFSER
jgi:hypothetical protein